MGPDFEEKTISIFCICKGIRNFFMTPPPPVQQQGYTKKVRRYQKSYFDLIDKRTSCSCHTVRIQNKRCRLQCRFITDTVGQLGGVNLLLFIWNSKSSPIQYAEIAYRMINPKFDSFWPITFLSVSTLKSN